jgi:hypothetical protein
MCLLVSKDDVVRELLGSISGCFHAINHVALTLSVVSEGSMNTREKPFYTWESEQNSKQASTKPCCCPGEGSAGWGFSQGSRRTTD